MVVGSGKWELGSGKWGECKSTGYAGRTDLEEEDEANEKDVAKGKSIAVP